MTEATNRVEIRNANPANEYTGDCVIRALVTATGDTYENIHRQLGVIAWQHDWRCEDMTARQAKDYIKNNGSLPHVWHKLAVMKYGMRVVDVRGDGICLDPDWLPGNCIVGTHNHAVAIKGGKAVDTWDSIKRGTKRVQYIIVDAAYYSDEEDDFVYGIVAEQDKVRRLRRNAKAKAARDEKRRERSVTEVIRKFDLDGGTTLRVMF